MWKDGNRGKGVREMHRRREVEKATLREVGEADKGWMGREESRTGD